jgi:quercetin dioxygenase-like cupin family protein
VTRACAGLVAAAVLLNAPADAANAALDNSEEARVADVLQSALAAHGAEVNRCFERALADTLDVSGQIDLSVDVGPGGKVTHAAPSRDEVKSPVLLACLEETALTWSLAGIDPGSTVVVPLAFEGQAAQFSIKVADAPEHGPPFSVKLLVDQATMHAQKAAVAQLTVAPANRIALHRHPGAEILYLLRGHARVLGANGVEPEKLEEGWAIYIPPQMPHAIENMGRSAAAVLLDIFVPPGPDRVYRDPKDPAGRAAFQVIHGKAVNPPGAKLIVGEPSRAAGEPVFGGKGKATPLLSVEQTGNKGFYLGKLEAEPGAQAPRTQYPGAEEILFVRSGGGELTVGSEKIPFGAEEALYLPAGQPHALKFTEKTEMVQIFAPAGPEDRYKDPGKSPR